MPDTAIHIPVIKTATELFDDMRAALRGEKPVQNPSRRTFETREAWDRWKSANQA